MGRYKEVKVQRPNSSSCGFWWAPSDTCMLLCGADCPHESRNRAHCDAGSIARALYARQQEEEDDA